MLRPARGSRPGGATSPDHHLRYIPSSSCDGNPCCFRPSSPSCSAVVLYSSKRPSSAVVGEAPLVGRALPRAHRREAPGDRQVLAQHLHRVDARHGGAHREAHGVAQGVLHAGGLLPDRPARRRPGSSCRWRRCPGAPAPAAPASGSCGSAASKPFSGSWQASNGKPVRQHAQVDLGILVPGEPDVAHLALRLRSLEGLDDPALARSGAPDRCGRRTRGSARGRGGRCAAGAAIRRAGASRPCASRPCVHTFVIRNT